MILHRVLAPVALLVAAALPAAAQQRPPARAGDPLARAFELERRGEHAQAVDVYRGVLAERPAEVSALLGLERALQPLGRSAEIVPLMQAAVRAKPDDPSVRSVQLRAWAAAGQPDSARAALDAWTRLVPDDDGPYREWVYALLARRDVAGAKAALRVARQRTGRADALAAEAAQLAAREGDYAGAAREWTAAVAGLPGYRDLAVTSLAQVTERGRGDVRRQLSRETRPAARFLEGVLLARWGDPLGGWRALSAVLPGDRNRASEELTFFVEQVRGLGTPEGKRAHAMALEALSERTPEPRARRMRLESAQLYADAGARDDAQRMLGAISEDRDSRDMSAGASGTLVRVLVEDGKLEEADRRLAQSASSLPADEAASLRRQVAWGWARQGRLARADSLLAPDSTVDGIAVRGRVRLLMGDVKGATEALRFAGPYAGTREEATARASLLATLQTIEADSLPELGAAWLALVKGDTAAAVAGLERVARGLPPGQGGAALQLLAGEAAAAAGDRGDAARLFTAAATAEAPATAPAAELALGRLLLAQGKREEAVAQFEHLILTYPQSALVPQARRGMDEARGAVPGR